MNILVVDDNLDSAESLKEFLELDGWNVSMVHTGEDALEAYSRQPYQLVVMDLKMPGIGGVEAIRMILEQDPEARIVVITGNAVEEDVMQARQLKIIELIRKPFDPDQLSKLVHQESQRAKPSVSQ